MSKTPPEGAFAALRALVGALEAHGYRYMLVGGLATFAWGDPRTTRDFDLAVLTDEDPVPVGSRLRQVLAVAGVEPQGPFTTDFGPRFVLPFPSVPVDVFVAGQAHAPRFARRRRVDVAGVDLWVESVEDLVVGKLRNARRYPEGDRPDLADAASALFKQWRSFDFGYARARAQAEGLAADMEALAEQVRAARIRQGLPAGP